MWFWFGETKHVSSMEKEASLLLWKLGMKIISPGTYLNTLLLQSYIHKVKFLVNFWFVTYHIWYHGLTKDQIKDSDYSPKQKPLYYWVIESLSSYLLHHTSTDIFKSTISFFKIISFLNKHKVQITANNMVYLFQ